MLLKVPEPKRKSRSKAAAPDAAESPQPVPEPKRKSRSKAAVPDAAESPQPVPEPKGKSRAKGAEGKPKASPKRSRKSKPAGGDENNTKSASSKPSSPSDTKEREKEKRRERARLAWDRLKETCIADLQCPSDLNERISFTLRGGEGTSTIGVVLYSESFYILRAIKPDSWPRTLCNLKVLEQLLFLYI